MTQARKTRTLHRHIRARLGNGHQTPQRKPGECRHRTGKFRERLRGNTALALFPANIDLDAHLQWRQIDIPLLGQTLGDPDTVDGMHP